MAALAPPKITFTVIGTSACIRVLFTCLMDNSVILETEYRAIQEEDR